MRANLHIIGLGLLFALTTGCESTRWNWLKRENANDTPPRAGGPPNVASLVNYLNDNANRIHSMAVDDMVIDVTIENQSFGLRGRIFAEKPQNFRMKAVLLGKDEVDIGSNKQEFWFWAAKNPDPKPYQYFCAYKDFNEGRVQSIPLPIQPEWVMETMGLGPYGPAEKYQLEKDDKTRTFRLVEHAKSPQGRPVRKIIVLNQVPVKAPLPQVSAYLLVDETTGKEVCSAHITRTTHDYKTGAILPYKMELRMTTQKMKLVLTMDGMSINTQIPTTVFQRPQMHGVEPFNIATGRPEPWGLQRAQGIK